MSEKSTSKTSISIPSKKKRNQKLGNIHFRIRIFGGVFVVFWIVFLFLESKYHISKQIVSYVKNFPFSVQSGSTETWVQITDFLENTPESQLSADKIETLGSLKEKIVLLEKLYQQNPSEEIKLLLINTYQLNHQYIQARKLFFTLTPEQKKKLPLASEFLIFLQSFSQSSTSEYQHLKELFDLTVKQGYLSGEEVKYYQSALDLAEGNYQQAKTLISEFIDPQYQDYKTSILTAFKQYESLQDVPSYYQDGLIALQLMNHGFYGLAKKIALPLVTQYPSYILPYQVLANSDFELGRNESALAYFQQLLKLDYQQKNNYLYHLWVLSYEIGEYSQAVMFFSQITDQKLTLDGDRYLVLSYLALDQEEKALVSWQRLIGYTELQKSDFYTFFQHAFYLPYREGKVSSYLVKDPKLVKTYLAQCKKLLWAKDQTVCEYGELGLQLQKNKEKSDLFAQAHRLARKYQLPEFYQLQGEIFAEKGHIQHAQENYLQALKLVNTTAEREYLKSLILKLTDEG